MKLADNFLKRPGHNAEQLNARMKGDIEGRGLHKVQKTTDATAKKQKGQILEMGEGRTILFLAKRATWRKSL